MAEKISRRQALKQILTASTGFALADNIVAKRQAPDSPTPVAFRAPTEGPQIISRTWNQLNDTVGLLGLGCMRLPRENSGWRSPINQQMTNIMVDYALAHGINYFDTASGYPGSEEAMGKALCRHPRSSYLIATKLSNQRSKDKTLDDAKSIFFNSLKLLKTDYVDFYLLHNITEWSIKIYESEEYHIIPDILKMKKEGKIRHLGFSFHGGPELLERILTQYEGVFEFVQIQCNYLDWTLQKAKEKYDVVKLSHHGTTKPNIELLNYITFNSAIISTNGRRNHPEKALLARLIKNKVSNIYFNYETQYAKDLIKLQQVHDFSVFFNSEKIYF